jgi:CheY-like chemotaxis protein
MNQTSSSGTVADIADARTPRLPKILVVDDDDAIRALLKLRLADTYRVIETGDPEQALALALEHKPEAILLDLMMPGFSGFELCQSFHTLSALLRNYGDVFGWEGVRLRKLTVCFESSPRELSDPCE